MAEKAPECILVKVSPEVSLKSKFVRQYFYSKLVSNLKTVFRANKVSGTNIAKGNGRLFIFPKDKKNSKKVFGLLNFVFGVSGFAQAFCIEFSSKEDFLQKVFLCAKPFLKKGTFKVKARREQFELMTSKEIEEALGSMFLKEVPGLKVKLDEPKQTVFVEAYKNRVYVYTSSKAGPAGLPFGCEGNAAVFFEGKKEELASAYFLMRRGCNVFPVAKKFSPKLKSFVKKLSKWNSFREFRFSSLEELSMLLEKKGISVKAIAFSSLASAQKNFEAGKENLAVFYPLELLPKKDVQRVVRAVYGN